MAMEIAKEYAQIHLAERLTHLKSTTEIQGLLGASDEILEREHTILEEHTVLEEAVRVSFEHGVNTMFVHQSLYWLTGVVFVCLFIYHRILYARGHDLGWTVGFALLLAFGISSALTFVLRGIFRSIVVFSEHWRCHVQRHVLL